MQLSLFIKRDTAKTVKFGNYACSALEQKCIGLMLKTFQ